LSAGKTVSPHAHFFVLASVLIDAIGFGIILPVTPALIMEVADAGLPAATRIGGWLLVVFAVLQFLCGPLIGNLSDRFGRRPVLLLSMLCFGLDYLAMALAPSLAWLFVGRALAGVAGAIFGPAYAFLADVTPPEKRAQAFGLMGAAFGLGFIIGPAIGGLLGELGTRAPFYAAAALAGANFLYGFFVLPETLAPERRRPFALARANPVGTLLALRRYPGVLGVAAALLLWQLAHQVFPSTWSFYAIARFGWSPGEIGASLAFAGVLMAFTQAVLTGKIVAKTGERAAVYLGLAIGAAAFVAYGFATEAWMVYAVMSFGALMGVAYPAMNAIMSRQVPAEEQGELQGGVASLYGISTIVGPSLMTQVLARFSEEGAPYHFPGAAFLLAALIALTALAMFHLGREARRTP
jgi:DHA1 family tetracycline resistance protein-like MFS transporter